jgi:hypothetical protein
VVAAGQREKQTMHMREVSFILASFALASCGPSAGDFGSTCTNDRDCKTGSCFTLFSGGYCSQRCEDAACPSGSRCAAFATGSFCLQSCTTSMFDCRSGYHCADVSAGSICFPDCDDDHDCGPGARCNQRRCEASSPGSIGAACLLNVGCASGRCEISYTGGYCTAVCAQDGEGKSFFDKSCPSGAVCAKVSEAGGLCHAACSADAQCRPEHYCDGVGSSGACRSRCRGAANCALGYTCDVQGGGACIEGSALPGKLGAACRFDGECDSSYCLDEPNQQFPKGVCSDDCTLNPSGCGAAGLCIVPADPDLASVCLQKCKTNFDCRGDYFCSEVANSAEWVCLPRCTAVPLCSSPEICDIYSGDCVPPGAGGATSVERVAIGPMPLSGTQTQREFSVSVPADAVSYTIVMKGSVGGTSTISRLTAPDGELLFDLDNYLDSKVRILPVNDGDFGMLFPNSPRVPLRAGTYRFTVVNEKGSGTGEVFALVKRSTTSRLINGKLNINFWFAGLAVNGSNAATDANMQAAISQMKSIYATAGITIDQIRYFDVPAAHAASFAVIDSIDGKDSELRRLFELSAGAPNSWLNMFLVQKITGGGFGYTILGIAGGIPGIPFEQGTNASGVAVAAMDLAANPGAVARTMAHEAGHWLGLWHTTEQNGQLHDPLSDTPECPASNDTSGDKIVSESECRGAGAENLMFWQASSVASTLTGNQGFVILRNPVVTSQ